MYIGEKLIDRPFRWGIVGGGKTSQVGYKHRLGAMRDNTSFVLTAAAFDVDAERCKEFGRNLCMDEDRCYPDYKTMFEAEAKREDGIEVVDVATPNFLHYEVTKAALEAGLHVICEKPLFFEVEQGEEIKKLAEEKGKIVAVTYGFSGFELLQQMRAMVAQVLYNFSGRPAVTQAASFSDVSDDQWFAKAVAWAQQNDIMSGYPNGTFGAYTPITRQDFAAVLYRYSNKRQLDTSARDNLHQYQDASAVSSYAQDAMQWAVASNIISGKTATQLAPRDSATRAECAQMLKNYLTGVASSLLS